LPVGSRRGVHGGEGGGGDSRGSSALRARGDRSEDREGRLDLGAIFERGCEHLLHGDGVRAPRDCHRDDGVDFGLNRVDRGADHIILRNRAGRGGRGSASGAQRKGRVTRGG